MSARCLRRGILCSPAGECDDSPGKRASRERDEVRQRVPCRIEVIDRGDEEEISDKHHRNSSSNPRAKAAETGRGRDSQDEQEELGDLRAGTRQRECRECRQRDAKDSPAIVAQRLSRLGSPPGSATNVLEADGCERLIGHRWAPETRVPFICVIPEETRTMCERLVPPFRMLPGSNYPALMFFGVPSCGIAPILVDDTYYPFGNM